MTGRGRGPPTSHCTPLLTCACATVPFIAQTALAAVVCAAPGLGCAGRGTHGLQLCPPPGPTTHIPVRSCPPRCPLPPSRSPPQCLRLSMQLGHRGPPADKSTRGGHRHSTHSAAPHSSARSSPHHRSRSRSPQGPHHSGHGRCSGRLERGTGRRLGSVWRTPGLRGQGRTGQPTLALGPKGTRSTEFTCCPCKP